MGTDTVLEITREAMKLAILLSAPMLICGLLVGLTVNVFQAVTQITENTLQFVPKILAMILALFVFSPWMLDLITDFASHMFETIPQLVR